MATNLPQNPPTMDLHPNPTLPHSQPLPSPQWPYNPTLPSHILNLSPPPNGPTTPPPQCTLLHAATQVYPNVYLSFVALSLWAFMAILFLVLSLLAACCLLVLANRLLPLSRCGAPSRTLASASSALASSSSDSRTDAAMVSSEACSTVRSWSRRLSLACRRPAVAVSVVECLCCSKLCCASRR